VPVLRGWASVSDVQAEAYLAASNRLVELGGWDEAELGALLADVSAVDAALAEVAGFDGAELARLLAVAQGKPEARTDPDDAPGVPAEPVSRLGDVWLLGPHRLICGDSTDLAVLERLMAGGLADCVWTDPPYGVDIQERDLQQAKVRGRRMDGKGVLNDNLTGAALADFLAGAFKAAFDVARSGAAWYVCAPAGVDFRHFLNTLADLDIARHTLVWVKDRFVMGRADYHYRHEPIVYGWKPGAAHHAVPDRVQDTVWEIARPGRSPEHPTMKPVELITRALDNSTDFGAVVLDPFGGSGSTLIACHTTQRVARLLELDPAYADVICHRYQAHTGTLPILEATGEPHDFTAAG
jgi:site-specific DNA-methyltransferase (adenine-specific)